LLNVKERKEKMHVTNMCNFTMLVGIQSFLWFHCVCRYSESEENADESAVESLDSNNSDDTVPPAPKVTKKEGLKWSVTGDKPSKFHFTGNPGIKPAIIRNLPPEPNPLDVFQRMVHDSLWDVIATETNRFAVQFHEKNPNSPTRSQWFPTASQEMKAYFAICVLMAQVKKTKLTILQEHP
jgi:hypothetical protein